jgi:predicted PurR-regulated permease PerM
VLLPVFIAFLLAYLVDPLVTLAQTRWRWPRVVTISLMLFALAAVLAGLALWLGPIVAEQSQQLVENFPGYVERIGADLGFETKKLAQQAEEAQANIQENPEQTLSTLWQHGDDALAIIRRAIDVTVYVALSLILIPIYFFFFAWHFQRMVAGCEQLIPRSKEAKTKDVLGQMDAAVKSFFRERVVVAFIVGGLFSLGWWLAGVPYWFLIGMAAGFLNIVPYAAVLGWLAAMGAKALEGGGDMVEIVVWPSVVYFIGQFLDGWVLTPWLEGRAMQMSSVTVLIVLFIGAALAGVLGVLLAIPVAACVKILFVELALPRIKQWAATH